MSNTINSTMDNVTTSTADFIDFDLIQADLTDALNYINSNKNLDKNKLKELRDKLSQLETILNNVLGDKPKAEKKTAKKATKKTSTKKATTKKTSTKKATAKKVEVETFDNDEAEVKAFCDFLSIGDTFQYAMADGTIITAKKMK